MTIAYGKNEETGLPIVLSTGLVPLKALVGIPALGMTEGEMFGRRPLDAKVLLDTKQAELNVVKPAKANDKAA